MTCVRSSARSIAPGRVWVRSATWFAIVAVGRKSDASWPRSSAIRRWSSLTDGSSRYCSSPTSAAAIAASIAGVGLAERVGAEVDRGHGVDSSMSRYRGRMDLSLLETTLRERGEPAYRAGQVWEWAARGAEGYDGDDESAAASSATSSRRRCRSRRSTVETQQESRDGTVKTLFRTADGHPVEAVLMRYRDGRRSLCLSSQSGCPLTCTFCATGQMAFGRNLTASEILDQALHFRRIEPVDHAVFMGMGEPMLNLDEVLGAARRLPDVGITHRRTTISTVGWLPGLKRFVDEVDEPIRLALSLHAADDELRSRIMPVNEQYPLRDVLAECRRHYVATNRRVFIEYVMLDGVNDSPEQARELARLLGPTTASR